MAGETDCFVQMGTRTQFRGGEENSAQLRSSDVNWGSRCEDHAECLLTPKFLPADFDVMVS